MAGQQRPLGASGQWEPVRAAAAQSVGARSSSASRSGSWRREVTPSFANALRRWYSIGLDADHQLVGDLPVAPAAARPAGRPPAPARSGPPRSRPIRAVGLQAGRGQLGGTPLGVRGRAEGGEPLPAPPSADRRPAAADPPGAGTGRPPVRSVPARTAPVDLGRLQRTARRPPPPVGASGRRLERSAGPGQPGDCRAPAAVLGQFLVADEEAVGFLDGPVATSASASRSCHAQNPGSSTASRFGEPADRVERGEHLGGSAAGLADPGPGQPQRNNRTLVTDVVVPSWSAGSASAAAQSPRAGRAPGPRCRSPPTA